MATYTFIAHEVSLSGSNYNVVGSSTFNIVLEDDDTTIGDPDDTGETISFDGGLPQSYTYVGTGTTDAGETMILLDVGGVLYGFNANGGNLENGNTKISFADLNTDPVVPCFTADAHLRTPTGDTPITQLRAGDILETRDNGAQPILRVLKSTIGVADQIVTPGLRPVQIPKHALGYGQPYATLTVSPQHRFLRSGWAAELHLGLSEVLVAAHSLRAAGPATRCALKPVTYYHIVMQNHELIWANGTLTETVLLTDAFMQSMPRAVAHELQTIFPGVCGSSSISPQQPAAALTRAYEGHVL